MQKVVFIVGPTAVGKTAVATKLAQNYNGSLISADSVQAYRGLDIVSGKDIPQYILNGNNTGFYTCWGIDIFLLDVIETSSPFSVSAFQNIASKAIEKISRNNKVPIVVGGTGFYIKSLMDGIATSAIKPDLKLRKKFEKLSVSQFQDMIPKEMLKQMNDSDINNKRRLIRKIEICSSLVPTSVSRPQTNFESLVIGLTCDREILKQRIDKRVEERLNNGALREAKRLFLDYKNLSQQVKDANGYKQLFQYLQNKLSWDEAVCRWKISEYRHAKNQMTWFRKYGNVEWFDISKKGFEKDIENSLKNFLR